uniref:Uncharacterized protein n=1 Tax=Caenorhabditis japonica TaxID=281687 RepID=A0A8R1DR01_CAEJA
VAQCLLDTTQPPPAFGTINGGQPLFPPAGNSQGQTSISTLSVPGPPIPPTTAAPTTTPSPFAPFFNLFGGSPGTPAAPLIPQFTLPTLPTTPPPTTQPPVDICSLPPITGSCSRARIMWPIGAFWF